LLPLLLPLLLSLLRRQFALLAEVLHLLLQSQVLLLRLLQSLLLLLFLLLRLMLLLLPRLQHLDANFLQRPLAMQLL